MCGIPIAEPGSPGGPLGPNTDDEPAREEESTPPVAPSELGVTSNDTIAMPMVPAQAQVISTMAQQAIRAADVAPHTQQPSTQQPSPQQPSTQASSAQQPAEAVTARPAPQNIKGGKTAHGVGLDQPLPPMAHEPPRATTARTQSSQAPPITSNQPTTPPTPQVVGPVSSPPEVAPQRREETWEGRAAQADSPFGTSTSVSLAGLGLPASRNRLLSLLGLGFILMAAGALLMYLAMKTSSDEKAVANDPSVEPSGSGADDMVLGMPLPTEDIETQDTEGLTGESTHETDHSDKPQESSSKKVKSAATTTNAGTSSSEKASAAKTNQPKGGTRAASVDSTSKPKGATSKPSSDNAGTGSGDDDGAGENPSPSADPGGETDTPSDAPQERDLALEMYSSRVRYAVSRYYTARAQSCFDNITKNQPDLRGTVQVAFKIADSGQVSGARITKNTTQHSGLGTCLVSQVNTWRLPPPPEPDIELQMPFSR